jgi:4-diphosphocytidyl-2-C-methyl-D-erythritol kinase
VRVSVFAPAKINLYLHVGPPRADGLHPLDSAVAFATAGDMLTLAAAEGLSLTITGPFSAGLEADETNLVLRAARSLQSALDLRVGAEITLDKRLPIASGIGGGSADAAAALRGLAMLWGVASDAPALWRSAAGLGADVPACLACRPARMRGVGHDLDAITLPPLWAVLVNPGEAAPTGAVYRRFDALGGGADLAAPPTAISADPIAALAACRNDLTDAACDVAPAIGRVLSALANEPQVRLARLSGSGATAFALVDDEHAAEALAATIAMREPTWWVRPVRLGAIDAAPKPL